MNVKGKVIAITGGAGGIGTAQTKLLAENGAEVWVLDIVEEKAGALAEEMRALGYKVHSAGGRLDVIVNNAGINIRKTIEEMSMDEWMKMMEVNTGSVFLSAKYAIPVMRAQGGGAIINTSSICGLIGHLHTPECYTATKGAVTLLTKSIASRYAKDNIRCNSIHPSTIDTPFVATLMADPVKKQARIDEVPLRRLATVGDVANAVLYLASDEASYLTGVSLPVDGGVTCY